MTRLRRLYGKLRLTVNDELDAALKAARRAIECCLKEASAGTNTGRTLEAIDAARSIVRNRA